MRDMLAYLGLAEHASVLTEEKKLGFRKIAEKIIKIGEKGIIDGPQSGIREIKIDCMTFSEFQRHGRKFIHIESADGSAEIKKSMRLEDLLESAQSAATEIYLTFIAIDDTHTRKKGRCYACEMECIGQSYQLSGWYSENVYWLKERLNTWTPKLAEWLDVQEGRPIGKGILPK